MAPPADRSVSVVEQLRIKVLDSGNIAEQAFDVLGHRDGGFLGIMRLDRQQDALMLGNHRRHPAALRQRELAEAVDMNLHLLDQPPDARISRDLRDGGVKQFVGLMEGIAIAGGVSLTLPLEDGMQRLLEISSIPTTILLGKNGQMISRMNGFLPDKFVDQLTERIQAALAEPGE